MEGFVNSSDGNYEAYYKDYNEFRLHVLRHIRIDKEGSFNVCITERDAPYYKILLGEGKSESWIKRLDGVLSDNYLDD